MITSAGAAHFGSAGILPIRVATDVVFVEGNSRGRDSLSPFSFTSPCCYILFAVLVSADARLYSAKHVVSLLMPVLDPLARANCLSLLILCEKVIAAHFQLSAYCTMYCHGENAYEAVRDSGRLFVPCFYFHILIF